jgi:hypothetical protein
MAQTLLVYRGTSGPPPIIGKNWVYKWIKSHSDLDLRLTRSFDSQRAKNEDLKIINTWFQRVKAIKQEHGITDDDMYNFNKTGFAIGMAIGGSSKVVTITSIRRATIIQLGDRKWITVIEYVNTYGRVIPLFVILKGKVHIST